MDIIDMIKVLEAFREGAKIEVKEKVLGRWVPSIYPLFNFGYNDYRVKKETVKLYKYAYKTKTYDEDDLWVESDKFFEEEPEFFDKNGMSMRIKRLDYTMIEVEK